MKLQPLQNTQNVNQEEGALCRIADGSSMEEERLADLAFLQGKKVKWALKFEDNEFYLYLKDIDADRTSSEDLLRELLLKNVQSSAFAFLELPPEVQLQILKEGCSELWGLYFDYSRKLNTFSNVVISRLVLYYVCGNVFGCDCCFETEDLVTFVRSANVEVLVIDVFEMKEFGKSILLHDAIQRLKCLFIFSNGDDVMSGIVIDPFFYDQPLELHGLCRLLADWANGSMEILHFHMYSNANWAADVDSILQEIDVHSRRGHILRNWDNQELSLEVKDNCITFTLIEQ